MSFLPTRDGDEVGKAQEFAMGELAGDCDEIRTVEWQNGDGSVTRLRTRGGMPIFETEKVYGTGASEQSARGFVAMVPGGRAVLFDPYTLAILDSDYSPAGKLYIVEEFATTWNVPASDTTHWYDVVLFDGTVIKINAKAMPDLQIVADQLYPAIPYVISRHDASDQYGNAERNATEKRVFAVGRYAVTSWGGGGVTKTLTPVTPRTDNKALTLGQAVDTSSDTATLAEFFFTGPSWDDISSGWGYSSLVAQMTTSAPFLSSSASSSLVDMARPSLANAGDSTGTMSTPITLPSTVVAITAHGHMTRASDWQTSCAGKYVYDGTISKEIPGTVDASYTRTTYTGSGAASCTQDGEALTYAATNTKLFDVRQETTSCEASTITLATGGLSNQLSDALMNTSNVLYWSSGYSAETVPPYRGALTMYVGRYQIPNTYCSRNHDVQNGGFSIDHSSGRLVSVVFSKDHSYGSKAGYAPNLTYYDNLMGSQASGWGMGASGGVDLYFDPGCVHYKNPGGDPGTMPASAKDELDAAMLAMGSAWFSQTLITDSGHSGIIRADFYYGSVNSSVDNLLASLSWETRDYLLFDKTNDVRIFVKGVFSASKTDADPAPASLTVTLYIETPWGSASQALYSLSYTYGNMLPENDTIDVGKTAIPSPQIRAIFTPKYREQGSFFGAAYVTKAEVANGATPACLINFVLSLETYSFIGTDETDGIVHFIPCNLIEMLYAFVFSRKYGVDPDERYPVDDATAFSAIMAGLFSVQRNIQFRDGEMVDWVVNLGIPYIDSIKTEIYRT